MLTISGRKPYRALHPAWLCLNQPSVEPISIAEAKLQARRSLDENTEDSLWQSYITAARNQVEVDTMRALCWQRWQLILDEYPDVIEGFKCPLVAVESVQYEDFTTPNYVLTTVDPSTYTVSPTEPWRVNPAFTKFWLPPRPQHGAVTITFTAGYLVPFTVSSNTLTFVDYVPTNGNSFRLSNSGGALPNPLTTNTTYYIVGASGNTCQLSTTANGSAITLSGGLGQHYLGQLPGALKLAMLKHIATSFADREGSGVAADCERSYLQSLRASMYVGL
jgi:uncharacterized phiE125 gp8 family phage protein